MNIISYDTCYFEECAALFHEVFCETYLNFEERFLRRERFDQMLIEYVIPHNQIFLAVEDDQLLGFIAIGNNFIDQLYIKKSYHNRGIGSAFIAKAKELYPSKLELYTFAQNAHAIHFYERHGFTIRSSGIAPDELQPDVLMCWKKTYTIS